MSDIKITGAGGFAERGGGGRKDKDECECRADHKTIGGKGTKHHPFKVIGYPISPAFNSTALATIIYARANGSDTSGNGSLEKPYRTFQRAVRDVGTGVNNGPRKILAGQRFLVDITGSSSVASPEILPPNYMLPEIDGPSTFEYTYIFPDAAAYYPSQSVSPFQILAKPQPATSVAPADQVIQPSDILPSGIVVDADTNLIEVHTSKSYAEDALKGLFLQDTLGMAGVIWHNTAGPNSIIYLATASFPDMPQSPAYHGGNVWPVLAPPLAIVQPSAVLQSSFSPTNGPGAFNISGRGTLGICGVQIMVDPAQFNPVTHLGVTSITNAISGPRNVITDGCDLQGFELLFSDGYHVIGSTIVHDGGLITSRPMFILGSYFRNLAKVNISCEADAFFQGMGFVFEGCPALGVRPTEDTLSIGRGYSINFALRNGVVKDAILDLNFARIADPLNFPAPFEPYSLNPALATPGYGILFRGGKAFIDHTKVFNCASDGIHSEAAFGLIELRSVTGGSGGTVFGDILDAPNGGYGLSIEDGVQTRIDDDDPVPGIPTSVTGTTAAIHVGTLPDLSTWTAFFSLVPQNYFDVQLAGGSGVTAQGTGARLFKKP